MLSDDPDNAKAQNMFKQVKKMEKAKEDANNAFKVEWSSAMLTVLTC